MKVKRNLYIHKNLIRECSIASISKLAFDAVERGHKAFNNEDYKRARSHFREGIKYLKKSGGEDTSSLLAEILYNIAITYWNEKNWSRAKEAFLEFRSRYPSYQKEDVEDFIDNLVNWGY